MYPPATAMHFPGISRHRASFLSRGALNRQKKGAELWAGRVVETRPLELLLNDLWTTVLRVPRYVSLYCVRRSVRCCKALFFAVQSPAGEETGTITAYTKARTASLIASARAFAKWRSSRTWMFCLRFRAPRERKLAR